MARNLVHDTILQTAITMGRDGKQYFAVPYGPIPQGAVYKGTTKALSIQGVDYYLVKYDVPCCMWDRGAIYAFDTKSNQASWFYDECIEMNDTKIYINTIKEMITGKLTMATRAQRAQSKIWAMQAAHRERKMQQDRWNHNI